MKRTIIDASNLELRDNVVSIKRVTKVVKGGAGLSEFRTGLALDECFDRLDTRSDTDLFAYECRRENDGSFLLHLTLHQPSQQPLDTLYTLRLDPGRQTVVTLIFIREAFGYKEPLFPPAMLDEFMLQKLDAHRTK